MDNIEDPIKPSHVFLAHPGPPLQCTFGSCEAETAAALLVLACRKFGDDWKPVTRDQVELARRELKPYWPATPRFEELAKMEFMTINGDSMEFTPSGIDKMTRMWDNRQLGYDVRI